MSPGPAWGTDYPWDLVLNFSCHCMFALGNALSAKGDAQDQTLCYGASRACVTRWRRELSSSDNMDVNVCSFSWQFHKREKKSPNVVSVELHSLLS